MRRTIWWTLALLIAAVLVIALQPEGLVREPATVAASQPGTVEPPPPASAKVDAIERVLLEVPAAAAPEPRQEPPAGEHPDPIQSGDCTLALGLVDAETRQLVAGTVQLWRLGAPGNEHWTEGDQLQAQLEVPIGGIDLEALPAGRYRVRCEQEADCVPDPEPFAVEGAFTRALIPIHLPKSFPLHLKVYDQNGAEIREAQVYDLMQVGHSDLDPSDPSWRRRRLARGGDASFSGRGGGSRNTRHPRWRSARAEPEGFLLGELRQDDRRRRTKWRAGVRVPQRQPLEITPVADATGPVRLVSVMIDPDVVFSHLFLPDGSSSRSLGTRLDITSGTLAADETLPAQPWLAVPIRVELAGYYGYEPIDFTFTLLDLPLPDRFLVAK